MEEEKEAVFAQLLFEKYEEKMKALHVTRKARYEAEVEMMNVKEELQLLEWRIREQSAYEEGISAAKGRVLSTQPLSTLPPLVSEAVPKLPTPTETVSAAPSTHGGRVNEEYQGN